MVAPVTTFQDLVHRAVLVTHRGMITVPHQIRTLQANGWTLAALADELDVHPETLSRWRDGEQRVAHPGVVSQALAQLLQRRDVPKKKRYRDGR